MPVTIDGWTITNARAAEIQAALQHHTSSESIPGVPELRQWIQRQIVLLHIAGNSLFVLIGQRCKLHEPKALVPLHDRCVRTAHGLPSPQARHPRPHAVQRLNHWLDLAQGAAQIGIGLPQIWTVFGGLHAQTVFGAYPIDGQTQLTLELTREIVGF